MKRHNTYGSSDELCENDIDRLRSYKKWHSNRLLGAIYIIQLLLYFFIFFAIQQTDEHYSNSQDQVCRLGYVAPLTIFQTHYTVNRCRYYYYYMSQYHFI